jgi:hypothetical protein
VKADGRATSADQFVDAVYRRWVAVHFCEQVGHGILVGSLLALALMPVAIWQRIPTIPILIFGGGVGFIFGVILAVYRRPSRIAAAVEADRQLRLDDLLTSAIFPSERQDAGFRVMVKNIADARCSTLSPSDVLLRRLGIRSWSGIALVMCVAVTLAVIPLRPSPSQAVDANLSVLSANPADGSTSTRADRGLVAIFNDPTSDNASSQTMSTEKSPAETNDKSGSDTSSSRLKAGGNTAGSGGGSASSPSSLSHDLSAAQTAGKKPDRTGVAAGGGAVSDHQTEKGDSSGAVAAASAKPARAVSGSRGGSPASSANIGAAASDRIPPEDRDLVRDFFKK